MEVYSPSFAIAKTDQHEELKTIMTLQLIKGFIKNLF